MFFFFFFFLIDKQATDCVTYTSLNKSSLMQIQILPRKGPISIQENMRAQW